MISNFTYITSLFIKNLLCFRECIPGECPTLKPGQQFCGNTVIQRKAFPQTEVCRTKFCGYGLRLLEPVSKGCIVIEYTGEVITADECERRNAKLKKGEDFYFAGLCSGFMLDAKPMGCKARFANHSCRPNCELQKWVVLGEPVLVLVALADLSVGTELTYNYQCHDDGWSRRRIRLMTCKCGASNCAGVIGGKTSLCIEDKWTQKAKNLLYSSKQSDLSTLKKHMDTAGDFRSDLYRELEEMAHKIDDWIRHKYEPLFALDSSVLVSAETVMELVDAYPGEKFHCEQERNLCRMVKNAKQVTNRVYNFFNAMPSNNLDDVDLPFEHPAANNLCIAENIGWDTLMSLFKEIYLVLPIETSKHSNIIHLLQLYEKISAWARPIYYRTRSPEDPSSWMPPKLSPWLYIHRISRYYGVVVTPYLFMLEEVLDNSLSKYMERAQLLSQKNNFEDSNGHTTPSATNNPIFAGAIASAKHLGVNADTFSSSDFKRINSRDDSQTLHCVCCLPEEDGEMNTLFQCEVCHGWFHPQCINMPPSEINKISSAKKQKYVHFKCPFCLYRCNEYSYICNPVSQDWFDSSLFRKNSSIRILQLVENPLLLCDDKQSGEINKDSGQNSSIECADGDNKSDVRFSEDNKEMKSRLRNYSKLLCRERDTQNSKKTPFRLFDLRSFVNSIDSSVFNTVLKILSSI